jgi:hypothetical protein
MTTVIERTAGHYEVQKTSYGEAYVWCPECIMVECQYCGERIVLTASASTCGCGADYAVLIQEEELVASRRASEEASHPWEEEYHQWREKQGEYLLSESHHWLEWRRIE